MSFTFSSTQEVNYLAIGACDICAVRLTHGCEHSDNQDYQEWLAAQVVAESGSVNEEAFITLIAFAEACDAHPADVAFDLESLTEAEQVETEIASDNQWLDSATVSESWQADAIAEAEFDADTKQTQEWSL